MAFVTCGQHKKSQDAQDEKIKSLEKGAISAEDSLLDKTGGEGGGKVTAQKIKEAIAGDIEVSVKENAGITGKGTKTDPLSLNLGDTLKVGEDGKLGVNTDNVSGEIGEGLAGNGLTFDSEAKQMHVSTVRIVDAAGRVIGYGVNQGV